MSDTSPDRLLAALARSADVVVVVDATGVVELVGPSARPVLGHDPDEIVGVDGFGLIHPDDQLLAVDSLASTAASPGPHAPTELRFRHRSGRWLPMRVMATNCLDDPDVGGIVLTMRDLSGLDEYEQALAERDDRYRQIVELAAEGVWVSDAGLRTTFVTARMAAMLGYRPEEMLGRPATEFMGEDARARAEDLLDRRRAGISEQTTFTFRHRDGHPVHTRVASSPIMGPGGELLGAIGMVSDVTDLFDERERLAADEARHRALLDALPDLVFRLDEHGTYLDFHARRSEDLAVPPAQFLGRRLRDVLPASADDAERAISEAIDTGRVVTYEVRFDDGGRQRTFESRVSPMPNRQVIVLVRDVTEHRDAERARRDLVAEIEQRRAEERIRAGLERQTRLEALGRLAGAVAHDINNLLGVVGNYAAVIERSSTDPTTVRDVHEIAAAVRRGSALTRRLLMFGRRDRSTRSEHDLVEVVGELVELLGRGLEPDHELVADLAGGPCPVLVDRDQVGQAVINLVVNAVDASPVGAEIRVEVRRIAVPAGGDVVELAVIDRGTGMSTEVRDRAFEPFFTTKADARGTGLGLSIVHGVAQDSGGSVDIESPPSGGTVVRMRFPVARSAEGRSEAPPAGRAGEEPLRVLVVDDDRHALRSTARLLEAVGCSVDVATSAAEAMARLRGPGAPDAVQLVLTDVVMPGTSGPALAAAVRSERPELPVVLMTAFGGEMLPVDTGGVVVLDKPLDPDEVRRVLVELRGQPV